VLAGFLGWTLDAFDFFVVVFLLDVLAAQFVVPKRHIVNTLTATLLFRPVGALIFGFLADRYDRRIPLMANRRCSRLMRSEDSCLGSRINAGS
jgi:MFS transporter, SHS family, lactate transporter